jgi:hypothetical protein
MNATIACGCVVAFILASSPVSAQSSCAECIKAADEELKHCLDTAISVDDKNTCEDNREEGMKACEDRECTAQREAKESRTDSLEQTR